MTKCFFCGFVHVRITCLQVVSERTKPRVRHFLSEVFLIIGGCTKDERFISTVTCLDPLRRSRLEVARLPITEMEDESQNRKWVEFACITFRNEVFISGERSHLKFLFIERCSVI